MTRIVSLVKLSPADAARIRAVSSSVELVEAGGYFEGEYTGTWPEMTVQRYVRGDGHGTRGERDAMLAGARILIAGFPFPVDLRARAPRLEWLHQTPAGASNLRRGDIWGSDVAVTTSRGLGETTAIAEYVIASMMYFSKGLFRAAMDRERGRFEHAPYAARSTETKTMCVVGAGGIGREVARLARAMGMRVLGTRRNLQAMDGDEFFERLETPDRLHAQLAESDVVAVCCQWTAETSNLMNAEAFAAMRADAVMINVARGEIVDEAALLEALDSGKLRGAALDVFVGEFEHLPPAPLWSHPRVLFTPHTSGMTDTSRRRSTDLFCENLRLFFDGRALLNTVDWERGY